jgi:hypothetical protein
MTTASVNVSYDPSNFRSLDDIRAKVRECFSSEKGSALKLKKKLQREAEPSASLTPGFQVVKPDGGSALRAFTLGELADSSVNEVTPQTVDPSAVNEVLFGRYGLISKTGGGRAERLMEDIEVAFIADLTSGTQIGPIITSGRHRTIALQLMLEGAGYAGYRSFRVRCSVVQLANQTQVQEQIINANSGSRNFPRCEVRERKGSSGGLMLTNCENIKATIQNAEKKDDFKAAFSAYIKLQASEQSLNTFTLAQYSDAGNSLWSALEKAKPQGKTLMAWLLEDKVNKFAMVMDSASRNLAAAVAQASVSVPGERGAKAAKLAKALAPAVIAQCF